MFTKNRMEKRYILLIVTFFLLIFSLLSLNSEKVVISEDKNIPSLKNNNLYSLIPNANTDGMQFYPNARFKSKNITYYGMSHIFTLHNIFINNPLSD